jgi:hypothetical protein
MAPNNNNNITHHEENERKIARLKATLEAKGNVKLECPCNKCRGFNRRRLVFNTVKTHCWRYGHIEGGFSYRPMVSYSILLYIVLFVLTVFIKFSFVLIFFIYTNFID